MVTAASHSSVLVVEDNPDLVMGLQDLLQHDGYAVTIADTIEVVRAHRFNTIILDLGLPNGDGLEVLEETQRQNPSLPVVIVTADISRDRTVGLLGKYRERPAPQTVAREAREPAGYSGLSGLSG